MPGSENDLPLGEYDWSNRSNHRNVGEEFKRLFRQHRFAEVHEFLIRQLATLRHPLAELCLDYEGREIQVLGWPWIQKIALEPNERTGELRGAIQLDYSGQGDFADGTGLMEYADGSKYPAPAGWWMSLVEVVSLEDEQIFGDGRRLRFSEASVEEIGEAAPLGHAWPNTQSRGSADALVRGLEELVGARYRLRDDDAPEFGPEGAGADFLASWYCALRWQNAIAGAMRELGLPREIPVIVGTHDLDPYVKVAYRPRLSDAPRAAAPRPVAAPSPRPAEERAAPIDKPEPLPEQPFGGSEAPSASPNQRRRSGPGPARPKTQPLDVLLKVVSRLGSEGPKGPARQDAMIGLALNVVRAIGKIPRR